MESYNEGKKSETFLNIHYYAFSDISVNFNCPKSADWLTLTYVNKHRLVRQNKSHVVYSSLDKYVPFSHLKATGWGHSSDKAQTATISVSNFVSHSFLCLLLLFVFN